MTFWAQVRVIAMRDLVVERRAPEALTIVLPFGLVALMAVPLAVGIDLPLIARVGPAIFWVTSLLYGMQVALRQSATDIGAQRDQLALLGLDPAARLVGRTMASGILLSIFMTGLAIAAIIFYSPAPVHGWLTLVAVAALFISGLALLATLAGEVTAGLGSRSLLAPLLVAPLAIPLLIGASQGQRALVQGDGILPWILLLVAVDLALMITAVLVARALEEAAR
jgi:heme exporter protein B